MPSMWDATAAGAGDGIDELLSQLLKQQVADESGRHNKAEEDISRSQLADNAAWRDMQQSSLDKSREAAAQDRDDSRLSTAIGRRPDGALVTGNERDKELGANVSTEGNYTSPDEGTTMGLNPAKPGQELDILDMNSVDAKPTSFKWDARDPNRAAAAPVSAEQKRVMFKDGTHGIAMFDPKARTYTRPSDGKDVTSLVQDEFDKPESQGTADEMIQTDEGWMLKSEAANRLRRGEGVYQAPTAQTRAMAEGAEMIKPHVPELVSQAEELDKRGLFGPLAGRLRDITAKYGSTLSSDDPTISAKAWQDMGEEISNDPALNQDELVGQFATTLGLMASGAGRVHGGARGGGSAQMLSYFKQLLSGSSTLPMFRGRMRALDSFMSTYAKGGIKKKGAAADAGDDSGYDPYGLLKK